MTRRLAALLVLCVVVFSPDVVLSQAPHRISDLIARLKDPKHEANRPSIRRDLVACGAEAVEPLLGVLKEENAGVRLNAIIALGELRDPRAIPALTLAIEDKRFGTRYRAILALGQICTARDWRPEYAPPVSRIFGILFSRLSPSQAQELCACSKALSQIFGRPERLCADEADANRKAVLDDWRKWFEANKGLYGIAALRSIAELVEELKGTDAAARKAAAAEIAKRGDANYARDLVERLAIEAEPQVEQALVEAIERLAQIKLAPIIARDGKKQALADFDLLWQARPHLEKLRQPDKNVRLDAVVTLENIKHGLVVDAVADQLEAEEDYEVRVALISALTKLVGEAPRLPPDGGTREIRRQIVAAWKKWAEVKPDVDKLRDGKADKVARLKAVDDLEKVDDFRVILALAEALDGEKDADILRRLVAALRKLRPYIPLALPPDAPEAERNRRAHDYMIQLLARNLESQDYLPRQDAVERIAQAKMKDRPLFEALLKLLKRAEISAQELQRVIEVLSGLVETAPKMPSTRREDILKAWDAWWEQNKDKF